MAIISTATSPRKKPLLWPHKLRLTLPLPRLLPLKKPLLTLLLQKKPQLTLPPQKPLLHLLPWMPQWPLWIRLLTTPPKSPL